MLKRIKAQAVPASLRALQEALHQEMPDHSVLWDTNEENHWTRHFGPISGSDPKLSNPAERYVIISFAYGTNMGAAQLAKHMRGIVTEHEITFANRRHITSEKLEAAKADLINRYHLYDLPKRWGDENIAAADGTQIGVPTFFPGVSPAKQERKERATEVFGERMSLLQASLGSTGRGKRGLPRNLAGSRWLFGVSRPKIEIRVKLGHRGNRQKR